ncbi:hypothetical protein HZ326_28955 [Fusarium oxysporum f. sp. albedinis]|nr:hypothetical protein HZ326_28955 [Fusarium oxysporum f. sp. albedinis]
MMSSSKCITNAYPATKSKFTSEAGKRGLSDHTPLLSVPLSVKVEIRGLSLVHIPVNPLSSKSGRVIELLTDFLIANIRSQFYFCSAKRYYLPGAYVQIDILTARVS